MKIFYVYGVKTNKPTTKYLGLVKAEEMGAAVKKARKRWPNLFLDIISKRYVADKHKRTLRMPKKL